MLNYQATKREADRQAVLRTWSAIPRFTIRQIAAVTGVSKSRVHRIITTAGARWHDRRAEAKRSNSAFLADLSQTAAEFDSAARKAGAALREVLDRDPKGFTGFCQANTLDLALVNYCLAFA